MFMFGIFLMSPSVKVVARSHVRRQEKICCTSLHTLHPRLFFPYERLVQKKMFRLLWTEQSNLTHHHNGISVYYMCFGVGHMSWIFFFKTLTRWQFLKIFGAKERM